MGQVDRELIREKIRDKILLWEKAKWSLEARRRSLKCLDAVPIEEATRTINLIIGDLNELLRLVAEEEEETL